MSEIDFDLSKAKFSDSDDLSQADFSGATARHHLSGGNTVSLESNNGQTIPVVRDAAGQPLKLYTLTATSTVGERLCWICFQPVDGPYTCFRAPCGSVIIEPM